MSSNSRNGFMGWIQKNPGKTFAAFLVLVVIITIIVMVVRNGSRGAAGPGTVKPSITLQPTQKILHPSSKSVETYMIEYATGTASAKYVDIVINWSNGAGFKENKIQSLKFTRKSGDAVIDTIDTEDLENSDMYVRNFATGLSVRFPGSTALDAYLGTAGIPLTIEIETIDADGTSGTLATKNETISTSDLDTTLTISSIVTIQASPVLSESFKPIKDTMGRATKYRFLFAHDSTVIPELTDVTIKVRDDGWIELYNAAGEQVNITNTPDTAQTYEFVKFGTDDIYLLKGRFDNTGDGGYLLYNKKTDGSVTGWGFSGSTLADGLNKILSDKTRYDKAFIKIQEFDASPPGPSRVYPPKPYPGTPDSRTVRRNRYSWVVNDGDYGLGEYTMAVSDSYMDDTNTGVMNDAEGLFDEGVAAKIGHPMGYTGGPLGEFFAYDASGEEKTYWFDFIMPVKIKLQKVIVFPRSVTEAEAAGTAEKWVVYGIDPLATNTHVLLKEATDVTFNTTNSTDLIVDQNVDKKFSQFKVVFKTKPNFYTVIQEIIFMGSDEEPLT